MNRGKNINPSEQRQNKPMPAFLCKDYPYQGTGEVITDLETLEQDDVLYEIKCEDCEMSIRSQGQNVKRVYQRLMDMNGCRGCGSKDMSIRKVDMSKAEKQ